MARKKAYDLRGPSREWHKVIPQRIQGKEANSQIARRRAVRKWIHRTLFIFFLGAFAWLIVLAWKELQTPKIPRPVLQSEVRFTSSEQQSLTREWFLRCTGIDRGEMPGIFEIKEMLEKVGQIKEASVTRLSNGSLSVHVIERKPILRMNSRLKTGEPVTRVVAIDGVVYEGINYRPAIMMKLPVLTDAEVRDRGTSDFVPGMEHVSKLLLRAFDYRIYGTWRSISLKEFPNGDIDYPGASIRVTVESPEFPEICDVIFSANPARNIDELNLYMSKKFGDTVRNELNQRPATAAPYGYDLFMSMVNREIPGRPEPQPRLIPRKSPR